MQARFDDGWYERCSMREVQWFVLSETKSKTRTKNVVRLAEFSAFFESSQ